MPRFTAASTVSLNFALANSLTSFSASSTGYCLPGGSLSFHAFMRLAVAMLEPLHVDAHAARAAGDGAHGGLEIGCGQIGLLGLRDLFELLAADPAHLVGVGRAAPLLDADRFTDQHGGGRRLHDEGEAAVAVDRDHHRDRQPLLHLLGLRIELLAE